MIAPDILRELQPWKEIIDVEANRIVGVSKVTLQKSGCNYQECNLGSFITDSYVHNYVTDAEPGEWTYAAIAIMNVGGIRTTLTAGGRVNNISAINYVIKYHQYRFVIW